MEDIENKEISCHEEESEEKETPDWYQDFRAKTESRFVLYSIIAILLDIILNIVAPKVIGIPIIVILTAYQARLLLRVLCLGANEVPKYKALQYFIGLDFILKMSSNNKKEEQESNQDC